MLQLARRALACSLGSKKDLRKQVYNITALHRHAVHPGSIMHAAALGLWARQLCRCAMVGLARHLSSRLSSVSAPIELQGHAMEEGEMPQSEPQASQGQITRFWGAGLGPGENLGLRLMFGHRRSSVKMFALDVRRSWVKGLTSRETTAPAEGRPFYVYLHREATKVRFELGPAS